MSDVVAQPRNGLGKRVLGTLALLAGSIVLAIIALEVGLRVAGISFPVFETYDPVRGSALRPGKSGWYRKEGTAFVEVNSAGYRDVEQTLEKPPNTFRIAVIGDSFVEARQVDLADTFWKRLEQSLASCPYLESELQVLGFGLGGHGTAQQLLTLRTDVLDYAPDLVLLAFFAGNDVSDNSNRLMSGRGRKGRPFFVLDGQDLALDNSFTELNLTTVRQRVLLWGVHYSRILEVVNQFRRVREVENFQARHDGAEGLPRFGLNNNVFIDPPDERWQEAWVLTERLLAEMNMEAAAGGSEFAVVSLSQGPQVHPDPAVRSEFAESLGVDDLFFSEHRLEEMGERQGFPVITLAQSMQARATDEQLFLHGFDNTVLGWGHWNADGHRVAADILSDALCESQLVSPPES